MKATKLNALTKNIFLGILTTMMIFSFTSCAIKAPFLTTSVAPAAEGKVKVKRDHNNNYIVKISVSNLVEVERLQPPRTNLCGLDAFRPGVYGEYWAVK